MNDDIINKVRNALKNLHLMDALNALKPLIEETNNYLLKTDFENISSSVELMLQYLASGAPDPSRASMLENLVEKIYFLLDNAQCALLTRESYNEFYTRRREMLSRPSFSISSLLDSHQNILNEAEKNLNSDNQLEEIEKRIFEAVWIKFPLDTSECNTLISTLSSSKDSTTTSTHLKCLIVSALTLSTLQYFDVNKLELLLSVYLLNDIEMDVQIRALVGVVLILERYQSERNVNTHNAKIRFDALTEKCSFSTDLTNIYQYMAIERNTDVYAKEVTQLLRDNISKISPDILKKLNKAKSLEQLESDDSLSDWMEGNDLSSQIDKLQKLQSNGYDIQYVTFYNVKNGAFFTSLSNWFLPFYPGHSIVTSLEKSGVDLETAKNAISTYCNSDMYSLMKIFQDMSMFAQGSNLTSMMGEQFAQIKELSPDVVSESQKREQETQRYIQDLYRFFTLYRNRTQFRNIFSHDLRQIKICQFDKVLNNAQLYNSISNIYFDKKDYNDAIDYLKKVVDSKTDLSIPALKKLAFCYQNIENWSEALSLYKRYDLAQNGDLWTLRHIAQCQVKLGQYDSAINSLNSIIKLAPEKSFAAQQQLANCYYFKGEYQEALNVYYQMSLTDSLNDNVLRHIAWLNFILKNYEQSENYHKQLVEKQSATAQDHLNYGHLLLAINNTQEAFKQYSIAFDKLDRNVNAFKQKFMADANYCAMAGIERNIFPLYLDSFMLYTKNYL